MPLTATLAPFFAVLFPTTDGFVEARALPSRARAFVPAAFPAEALAAFLQQHADENLYVGTATRATTENGTAGNCAELWTLYIDVDFAHVAEATARDRLARFPIPPAAIVETGGGLHSYWALRDPFVLPDEAEAAASALRRLAAHFNSDPAVAEPARVLRIPGTTNRKYQPPRAVALVALDPDRRVNLSEILAWLPADPQRPQPAPRADGLPFDQIREGTRNNHLYHVGRALHARGVAPAAIRAALRAENEARCRPPFPIAEVDAIAAHCAEQRDREDFTGAAAPPTDAAPRTVAETWPVFYDRLAAATRPGDLVPALVPGLGLTVIHGQPRALKTWTLLELACALATATPAFGLERFAIARAAVVWFVTDEDPELVIRDRVCALLKGRERPWPTRLHVSVQRGLRLDDRGWQQAITAYAQTHAVQLTIVDPIRSASAAVDQGPIELAPLRDYLRGFMRTTGSAVAIGHHDVKPPAGKADERARPQRASGGGMFSIADAPIHLERLEGETSQTVLTPTHYKFSTAPAPALLTLTADDASRPTWVRLTGEDGCAGSTPAAVALQRKVLEHLRTHPNTSGTQLAATIHRNKRDVLGALDVLLAAGAVDFYERGQAKCWFVRSGHDS